MPDRWEYDRDFVRVWETSDWAGVERRGREGWEVITIIHTPPARSGHDDEDGFMFFFKRRLSDEVAP